MVIEFDPLPDNRVLSEKIVSRITDAIVGGGLRPGDRLPPERELAGQFGVSRTVVREATKTLSGRGILRSNAGPGSSWSTRRRTWWAVWTNSPMRSRSRAQG